MTIRTKSWTSLKKKVGKVLKIGSSRVSFTERSIEKVLEKGDRNWTLEFAKNLVKEKLIKITPKKKRLYKIYYRAKPENVQKSSFVKVKKTSSLRYLIKRKMVTSKDQWIRKIRAMRALLKKEKPANYGLLRRRAKGNYYKTVEALRKECLVR